MGLTRAPLFGILRDMTTTQTTSTAAYSKVETAFFCWHYGNMDFVDLQAVIAEAGMTQEQASAISNEVAEYIEANRWS